jgi:hypothetical protein
MEVSDQFNTLATLLSGKKHLLSIAYEAEWVLEAVWMLWGREKYFVPAGN